MKYPSKNTGINKLSPVQKIALSFIVVIFVGSLLLMLPISNNNNEFLSYIDALFTATSATCVTGLVVAPTPVQFSVFGQVVIIILIQIGGLGLMTLIAIFILKMKRRLSLKNSIAMKEVYAHIELSNLRTFLSNILKFTFACEGLGTIILMTQFIPKYGIAKGLFGSIFVSISAFCNAGFDNLTDSSLLPFADNIVVNYTVMALIVTGGLGFIVWFNLRDKLLPFLKREVSFRRFHHSLSLQTKMVISMTLILIFVPAFIIFLLEFNNSATIGSLPLLDKITAALFSSVTLRTAGFATIDFSAIHPATSFLMSIVMFIGGSPGGTAGGVKTTTILVIAVNVMCAIRGTSNTHIFKRHISRTTIVRCLTVLSVSLLCLLVGVFSLLVFEKFSLLQLLFEAASALATVGLTMGITPYLSISGKIVLILLMFVGRIGIMTFILSLVRKENTKEIEYAEGQILIG